MRVGLLAASDVTVALIAACATFIGALIGALATGGIRADQRKRDRRAQMAAARLVHGELIKCAATMETVSRNSTPRRPPSCFPRRRGKPTRNISRRAYRTTCGRTSGSITRSRGRRTQATGRPMLSGSRRARRGSTRPSRPCRPTYAVPRNSVREAVRSADRQACGRFGSSQGPHPAELVTRLG